MSDIRRLRKDIGDLRQQVAHRGKGYVFTSQRRDLKLANILKWKEPFRDRPELVDGERDGADKHRKNNEVVPKAEFQSVPVGGKYRLEAPLQHSPDAAAVLVFRR